MAIFVLSSSMVALLLVLQSHLTEAIKCASCASPILMQNWHSTGFPTLTDFNRSVVFTERCDSNRNTEFLQECSSVCMEMLLVVAGQYAVLRGCHQTLLGNYKGDVSMTGDVECNFGSSFQDANIDGKLITNAAQGVRFCRLNECNLNLEVSVRYADGSGTSGWDNTCKKIQTSDCISCLRFDNLGDCHPDSRETCQAAWCTKNIGYLNGREVEMRGCSSINPLSTAMCVRIDVDHVFTPMSDQHLHQRYAVDQCFCQGSKCNPASGLRLNYILLMLAPVLLVYSLAKHY